MTVLQRVFHNRGMLDGNLLSYALASARGELPSIRSYGEQQMDEGAADDDDDEDDDTGLRSSFSSGKQKVELREDSISLDQVCTA